MDEVKNKRLILETGGMYKRRDGMIVGPVKRICDTSWDYWIPTSNFKTYRKDGVACLSGWLESPEDLVEKVPCQ